MTVHKRDLKMRSVVLILGAIAGATLATPFNSAWRFKPADGASSNAMKTNYLPVNSYTSQSASKAAAYQPAKSSLRTAYQPVNTAYKPVKTANKPVQAVYKPVQNQFQTAYQPVKTDYKLPNTAYNRVWKPLWSLSCS